MKTSLKKCQGGRLAYQDSGATFFFRFRLIAAAVLIARASLGFT
jgi:hypothetical protein